MTNWMKTSAFRRLSVFCSLTSVAALAFSCSPAGKDSTVGSTNNGATGAGASASGGGSAAAGPGAPTSGSNGISLVDDIDKQEPMPACTGLACAVPTCVGGAKTTISGKVYDPAGKVPLYNVLVYVPNTPVEPFKEGAACDRCAASVLNPVTSAVTDEQGAFTLIDAPAGQNVPLVIQVGKWRRQLLIPAVAGCADTPLMDPQMMRLPRNKAEGDIPRIAISVGAADQMECLPLRMGLDPAEFTTSAGDGRIHLFAGDHNRNGNQPVLKFDATHNAGAELTPSSELWASADALLKYDITILSCEGDSFAQRKTMPMREAMYGYASQGGRVFASHWHDIWFAQGPQPVPTTGTWGMRPNPAGDTADPVTATINQTFPKGEALAKWLVNVGASTTQGQMALTYPRDNLQTVNPMLAREWISVDNPKVMPGESPKAVQYMSFNAPLGVPEEQICGRAVYTNVHVASVDNNTAANAMGFPASCEMRDLSAQEKAVAFMLFDLSACVQNEDKPPMKPK
jgi:hypothetical protein